MKNNYINYIIFFTPMINKNTKNENPARPIHLLDYYSSI